jgi:RNA polymerase sigma-70 factor (ECF subfamily)
MERIMQDELAARRDWFHAVLAEFEGPLLRYTAGITHDLDAARDVVQDAFIRLYRVAGRETVNQPGPWLYKVCRNRAVDVLRKRRFVEPLDEGLLRRRPAPVPDPASAAAEHDDAVSVLELVAALPRSEQEVIRLRFQAGLKYREISDVTGLSVSNVGYLLHNAVRHIRRALNRKERLLAQGALP